MQILPDYRAAPSVRMLFFIVAKVEGDRGGRKGRAAGRGGSDALEGKVKRHGWRNRGEEEERNLSAAPMGESSSF